MRGVLSGGASTSGPRRLRRKDRFWVRVFGAEGERVNQRATSLTFIRLPVIENF